MSVKDTINRVALLEWVEHLETTDNPQTKKYLDVPGVGRCCLGEMCNLFADRIGLEKVQEGPGTGLVIGRPVIRYRKGDEYGSRAMLPNSVTEFMGLKDSSIWVQYEGKYVDVSMLNDGPGLTFKEIAALVRKEYDL